MTNSSNLSNRVERSSVSYRLTNVVFNCSFCKIGLTFVLLLLVLQAHGATRLDLATWTFGADASHFTLVPDSPTSFLTTPTMTLAGGTVDSDGKDGNPGQAAAWDDVQTGAGNAVGTIALDTRGFAAISVQFDYRGNAT